MALYCILVVCLSFEGKVSPLGFSLVMVISGIPLVLGNNFESPLQVIRIESRPSTQEPLLVR